MAEKIKKGVIIEFDFAVLNGAEILFNTTSKILGGIEVPFDKTVEAQHLAGGNYQGGLAEYFAIVKTKKTAQKAAKDISEAFARALTDALPAAVTPQFKEFVNLLTAKGIKVVIATRADKEKALEAFADILTDDVSIYQEASQCYGGVKWDAWRRACALNKLRNYLSLAVTGSGHGVKSALLAGMGSVAVMNDHVAYQDFGGADEVVKALDKTAVKAVCRILRVE